MKKLEDRLAEAGKFRIPYSRAWNIGTRTAHILAFSVLVGGHVFGVAKEALMPWLCATLVTGAALSIIEAFPSWRWFYQGRGVLVLSKLALLAVVPYAWDYRVAVLFLVVVITSVGSHMPGRYRYFSVVHGQVLKEDGG